MFDNTNKRLLELERTVKTLQFELSTTRHQLQLLRDKGFYVRSHKALALTPSAGDYEICVPWIEVLDAVQRKLRIEFVPPSPHCLRAIGDDSCGSPSASSAW